jgi:competence protein ComFC
MKFLKDIANIFFPELCSCCLEQLTNFENTICIKCRHDLPVTNFSFEKNNLVEKSFYGRIKIENATALFYFLKKGKTQQLIHELKYNNQEQIGTFIGNWLGEEMLESERFNSLDYIIPVPLHPKKLKKRGYNQTTNFGQSLAFKLNVVFNDSILTKVSSTKTQSKKLRLDRWKNVEELFTIQPNIHLQNKHILIVDDIITTGATLEACSKAFSDIEGIKISIACMAYTK